MDFFVQMDFFFFEFDRTSSHQYQVKTQFKGIKDLQATKQADPPTGLYW